MLDVEVTTREGRQPLPKAAIVALVRTALRRVGIRHASVSIAFVSDVVMRRLNRSYRKRDAVTDVLSFGALRTRAGGFARHTRGAGRMPRELTIPTGEIVIAPREAARRAKEHGVSLKDELLLLLVHGSLHLAGYDHERPKDAAVMLPLQENIIAALERKA